MKETVTQPLILVDGSSYLFRAYHAMPPLTNSDGEPTGAIYGVINMLRKLLLDYPSPHIAVIFDSKEKTFRHEKFPDYKANRAEMDDELAVQIQPIHQIIKAMGLPLVVMPGVEADDIIGTLATQATSQGMTTVIVTGDKDMAQLVNDKVTLVNTMTDKTMDVAGVHEKFGIGPELIIDYLALMGDTVDNIPGVPKVGPKTAVKWLTEYGSLDVIMTNAEQFKGKVGENLRASLATLPLSKELTTIVCDLELDEAIDDLVQQPADNQALAELFKRYEFKNWLKALDKTETTIETNQEYEIIYDKKRFKQWLSQLKASEHFAFDTETTSLDYMQAEIVGVSFASEVGKAAYVPVAHDYMGAPNQLDRDWVLAELKPLLESSQPKIIGQNLKYDMSVLANYDIHLSGIAFDTMLESYVLNSTGSRHDMDSLAQKYLDKETIHYEDIAGKGAKQISFNQVEIEEAGPYAAEDADITLQLHHALWPQLDKQLATVFTDVDLPLVPVLSRIERNGVLIDVKMLERQSEELQERLSELTQQAFDLAGSTFNLSSPKQLQAILFEQLKLPVIKKTPGGQPSTAEDVLQELAYDYPLPKLILEYRSLSKLKSTYTDKLPEQIDRDTQRIHTSYHQAVTATGRLSSSDPNLQNIPVRTEQGRRIREAFIARPDHCLIAADYSQIELRIMAHLSQDQGLLTAFEQGLDIHKATAAEVFGVATDQVTSDQRRSAKAINFGLIYGMSAFGLAKQLDIPQKAAQEYVDVYFARYPGVKDYMENTREQAHAQGYVETLFGRRLYLPEINARNIQRQKAAERTAINAPMQGTAADIIKKAMISCDAWLQQNPEIGLMIMQVHDELVFEIDNAHRDNAKQTIQTMMQQSAELAVPLIVDVGVGMNWNEAH